VLAYRIEDITALNAVDNYWPLAEKPERIGHPIRDRRMRIDIVRVYDVDIVIEGNAIKLGTDRV
jgi:hypothetical protein